MQTYQSKPLYNRCWWHLLYFALLVGFPGGLIFAQDETSNPVLQPSVITPLLTIGSDSGREAIHLTPDDLSAFPKISFKTYDPWDQKNRRYEGVRIIDILIKYGLKSTATHVDVIAINDYSAMISITDLKRYGHILSNKMDGQYYDALSEEENKGPLAVAINFDGHPGIDMRIYKQQLVWWVKEIIMH